MAGVSFALLQSLVAPALREIQLSLDTSTAGVAWILTGYLLSASVATPIAGRLGDIHGKRRVLVITLAALAVGTLVAALATSIQVMIIGRLIQGLGGAVFPLAFGIIRDEFPAEQVPVGIALISAILGFGGGLGIVLAGPITEHLSYHWLFWLPLVPVVVSAVAAQLLIPESPVRAPGRINWGGAALLSGWLVCLLLGVTQGSSWGWTSPRVLALLLGAAVLLVVWIIVEGRSREPLVDMTMMRIRGVWTTNLAALLIGFGMYSSFVLIPQLVETPASAGVGFGSSVTQAGLFMLPSTVAMLLVSPIAGRIAADRGARLPLGLGAAIAGISYLLLAFAHDRQEMIYVAAALLGIGIGFAFSALANLIVAAVPRSQTGIATGMNTIMRTIGGALGSQISAAVLTASVVAGLPTDHGFTVAFTLSAAVTLVAVVAAILVPPARRPPAGSATPPRAAVPAAAPRPG
jgi:EmrB/QacA subfamily drug resistance transporter